MRKYIFRRILYVIPILLITSFIIFSLLRLGGSDPVAQYLFNSGLPSTAELEAELRSSFGLDKPLLEQYILWLRDAIHLDFGTSYMTGRDVAQDFASFVSSTLILITLGFVFSIIFSVLLGIVGFIYHNRFVDKIISFICFLGVSVPNFWLAFLLIFVFSIQLDWLPSVASGDSMAEYIMPTFAISFMTLCINAKLIKANMLEIQNERYVLYAKMRGIGKYKILFKHIFYNSLLPIVTALGMHIGELLGGALLIESIFAIPGVGLYGVSAIANHDFPVITCFILSLCLLFVICNLLTDILYVFLDHRLLLKDVA